MPILDSPPIQLQRRLRPFGLIAVTFFCVAGGAFGLEDAVGRRRAADRFAGNSPVTLALEFSHCANDRRTIDGDAGSRRLRRLGRKGVRPILGISRRLAQLAVQFCRQRALSGDVPRLSHLSAWRHGTHGTLAHRHNRYSRDHLDEYSRYSTRWVHVDSLDAFCTRAIRHNGHPWRVKSRDESLVCFNWRHQLAIAPKRTPMEHLRLGQRRLLRRRGC